MLNLNTAKKVLSVVMMVTLLMFSTVSFAVPPQTDSVQWNCVYEIENYLEDSSTLLKKSLELYASTEVYDGWYAGVTAQLQKLNSSGTSWSDVSGKYYESYDEDYTTYIYKPSISVSAGTYRFKLVHTAYSTTGVALESITAYTNTITIY